MQAHVSDAPHQQQRGEHADRCHQQSVVDRADQNLATCVDHRPSIDSRPLQIRKQRLLRRCSIRKRRSTVRVGARNGRNLG